MIGLPKPTSYDHFRLARKQKRRKEEGNKKKKRGKGRKREKKGEKGNLAATGHPKAPFHIN